MSNLFSENEPRIVVFGATGRSGTAVVKRLLENGYLVTAFVRDPERLVVSDSKLRVVIGDVLNPSAVLQAVRGHSAVISCLGAGRSGGIRSEGTRNIVWAMENSGVKRIISQSSLGVGESRGNLNFLWKHIMFGVLLRQAYIDHGLQEGYLKASSLDWTIVRPAALTEDEATGEYRHGFPANDKKINLKIALDDLAHFIVQELEDGAYLHQSPGLSFGEV